VTGEEGYVCNIDIEMFENDQKSSLFDSKKVSNSTKEKISALIDQDPVISEQLTLWGQHGSTVVRGRMILLPVGNTVLYLQPIYLISTKTKIPELARVIVANGDEMVMHRSATEAFKQLQVKLGATSALIYPELDKKPAKPISFPTSMP
jgi:uncharacterized membrane protein (UPF0182 family)